MLGSLVKTGVFAWENIWLQVERVFYVSDNGQMPNVASGKTSKSS